MNTPFEPAALDVGYGWTKSKTSHAEVTVPSIVGQAIAISYQTDLVTARGGLTVELDGRSYFVGERARLQSPDPLTPQSRHRSLEIVKVLGLTALHQAGAVNISHLVTGLPVSWYADDKDALEDTFTGEHSLVVNGTPATITIKLVKAVPQPMGTIFKAMISNGIAYDPRHLAKHKAAVMDIGMYTSDDALIDNLVYIEKRSRSTPVAGGAFFQNLQRAIKHRYDLSLSLTDAESAAHSGSIILWGKEVKLPPAMVAAALRPVADHIIEFTKELWTKREAKTYRAIFVSGGNAFLFYSSIRDVFRSAVLVDEPRLAPLRGFYEFALLKERKGGTTQ